MSASTLWASPDLKHAVDREGSVIDATALPPPEQGKRTIYLCGEGAKPNDLLARLSKPRGWRDAGSNLGDRWRLHVKGPHDKRVSVFPISVWLADQDVTPHQAQRVMLRLGDEMRRRLNQKLDTTPAGTGFWAWRGQSDHYYSAITREVRDLFTLDTQGRQHTCAAPGVTEIPALYTIDLRMAYSTIAMDIQSAPEWRHEQRPGVGWPEEPGRGTLVPGFLGYTPGRYLVRFRAPEDWRHVSILGNYSRGKRDWLATEGETWADAREVGLAIDQGWQVEVIERAYAVLPEGRKTFDNPLKHWAKTLLQMDADLRCDEQDGDLLHDATRAILLQTIGLMSAKKKRRDRKVSEWGEVPDTPLARATAREVGEDIVYTEEWTPIPEHMQHPELASQIWGRTRVALLRRSVVVGGERVYVGALQLPREDVIGFNLDCLYLARDPRWVDDGAPGRYRTKQYVAGPHTAPVNLTDVYAIAKAPPAIEPEGEAEE